MGRITGSGSGLAVTWSRSFGRAQPVVHLRLRRVRSLRGCLIPDPEKQCHSEGGARDRPGGFHCCQCADRRIWWMGAPPCRSRPFCARKPRSTGCTVAEPDSSVGAPALARGKDHTGAFLRMTAILVVQCFSGFGIRIPCTHAVCHFEGGATPHHWLARKPARRLRNLLSAAGGSCAPRHWPCQFASRPHVQRGLPRLPSSNPTVDSSALQPLV
jgi:hypothetical protein